MLGNVTYEHLYLYIQDGVINVCCNTCRLWRPIQRWEQWNVHQWSQLTMTWVPCGGTVSLILLPTKQTSAGWTSLLYLNDSSKTWCSEFHFMYWDKHLLVRWDVLKHCKNAIKLNIKRNCYKLHFSIYIEKIEFKLV